eukprot:TRINITY_DN28336_c0_g1_i1.p1 TRINITY_DN28336_c0_g1~~TRINITY_DN28336_c0_g1_i1.p1  ORF type:complete len:419 (+),score=72.70 TRINITY_DN28336_c0_g1_i1:559-1815(+)
MSYRESTSYYKKEYLSKNPNKNWSDNNEYYSRYKQNPRKTYPVRESYSNHSNNHHSKPKYETSNYNPTSRKSTRESANSHRKQSWSSEKDGKKRNERNFLDYIGVETDESIIAKRQHQIDAAKASLAYTRYSMLVAKNQRITDMPQTPNKFMKTDTDRWMRTVKKWVSQLRGWELPGSLSLPSPVWVPEEKRPQESSPTPPPLLDYESESSEESPEKYRPPKRGEFYEKKNERKRRRSLTPSPPRERPYNYNSQPSHHKYPRTSHDTQYPPRGYTKKIHYEAFSNTEDFISNSPKVERKVSYVKDYGPRFTHTTRPTTSNHKEDLRLRMKANNHRNYRTDTERPSYTNISWSPDNSPRRPTHSSTHYSYGRPRSLDIPRDRLTSPITPPTPLMKEITPEFDIPGQDWEMKNEVVLLDV